MTYTPKVIDPPNFDQQKVWDECSDWVESYDDPSSIGAAAGADPGICSCPACGEYYWMMGKIQECVICGFQYPTDAWPAYSKGVQDGMSVASGAPVSGGMKRRMKHHYYAHGFNNPPEGAAYKEMSKVDWRSVAPEPCLPLSGHGFEYCERCGKDKENPNRSGVCDECKQQCECRHRVSLMEDQCEAGVIFAEQFGTEPGWARSLPCYYSERGVPKTCPKFEPITAEDIAERESAIERSMARLMATGPLVAEIKKKHKGKDWAGTETCPVCQGVLHMSHAKYNGHVHAKCETENCIAFTE